MKNSFVIAMNLDCLGSIPEALAKGLSLAEKTAKFCLPKKNYPFRKSPNPEPARKFSESPTHRVFPFCGHNTSESCCFYEHSQSSPGSVGSLAIPISPHMICRLERLCIDCPSNILATIPIPLHTFCGLPNIYRGAAGVYSHNPLCMCQSMGMCRKVLQNSSALKSELLFCSG